MVFPHRPLVARPTLSKTSTRVMSNETERNALVSATIASLLYRTSTSKRRTGQRFPICGKSHRFSEITPWEWPDHPKFTYSFMIARVSGHFLRPVEGGKWTQLFASRLWGKMCTHFQDKEGKLERAKLLVHTDVIETCLGNCSGNVAFWSDEFTCTGLDWKLIWEFHIVTDVTKLKFGHFIALVA